MTIFRNAGIAAILTATIAATAAFAQQPAPPEAPAAAAPAPAAAPPVPPEMEVCGACHGLTKTAEPSLGPNLWGVGGRKAGSTDYAYSPAMKAHDVTWTVETLTPFIQNPRAAVPGTTMAYPGVPDPAAAKAIADYLMTLHDAP